MVRLNKIINIILLCVLTHFTHASISVPFELINGLIIIQAEVNGTSGSYIIDSGSNGILLNGKSASSDVSYQTLSSTMEGSETKINSFKVGDFHLDRLLGFSTDLSNLEVYLEKPIAGILGCSVFTPHSLVFDFKRSVMSISYKDLDASKLGNYRSLNFEVYEDLPMVELKIQGAWHTFILDSGASTHFVDKELVREYRSLVTSTGNRKNIITAGGRDQVSEEYEIPSCEVGGEMTKITAYEKDFSPISRTLGKNISGLLSLSSLSDDLVYFDLKANKFYFK